MCRIILLLTLMLLSLQAVVIPTPIINATDGAYLDKVVVSTDTQPADGAYYEVYRGTSTSTVGLTLLGTTTSTTYSDISGTPGFKYYYFAKGCLDGLGCTDYSSYNTGYRKIATPTNISASDGTYADSVVFTYSSVEGASHYYIYRSKLGEPGSMANIMVLTINSFTDTTGIYGVAYIYSVHAYSSSSGSWSDVSVTDMGYRTIPPPDLVVNDGTTTENIKLFGYTTYRETENDVYYIYRSTSSTGEKIFLGSTAYPSYYDATAVAGVLYYYFVKTYNGAGYSDYSDYKTGTAVDSTGPTGYSVSFDDAEITQYEVTTSTFTFNSAEVGATYNYTVSSSRTSTPVSGSGSITDANQNIQLADLSGLLDGTLTLSVILTDPLGNAGSTVTANTILNTVFEAISISKNIPQSMTTSEGNLDDTAPFDVSLTSLPEYDVVISASSSDVSEGIVDLPLSKTLTFTQANWNIPQQVTIIGVDDSELDGDVSYSIDFNAASSDSEYNGKTTSVDLINLDNETGGINPGIIMYLLN